MTMTLFTDGWTFHRDHDSAGEHVRLPHDAMIGEPRTKTAGTDNHGGFFPGGAYVYRKRWEVPREGARRYRLFFEGVYGNTRILVNGSEAGRSSSPYREFFVPLDGLEPGSTALLEVQVDNQAVPNSRWYSGAGIYRPVWLHDVGATAIAHDGVRIVTRSIEVGTASTDAVVDVTVLLDGSVPADASAVVEFRSRGELVARRRAGVTNSSSELAVPITGARPWSAEEPHLYDVTVFLLVGDDVIDERTSRVGLRTITVDAARGLRINGRKVLLRGTAVHHDNGVLGAATFAAAERRRARLLKEAGYNAIRSAHNPLSRAFLDACDELGLYVLDELTDVWIRHKTPHDGAERFLEEWRHDAAAMVAKDRNRPSVILYSLGNEIAEAGTEQGVRIAQQIRAEFAALDPTRQTTIAVNPLLAMMAAKSKAPADSAEAPPERKPATSTAANQLTAKMGRLMVLASTLPAADRATRDVFGVVDVAGYNYGYANYAAARRRYPERVILGTESMPGDLPAIWRRVRSVPGVIGDFGWTGWDYLGEVGLGYWSYGSEPGGIAKPYPGILAGCGIFDITGVPGATLLLAQAVWGITGTPGIGVRPLDRAGDRPNKTPWLPTDAIASWSWGSHTGVAEIEVYSADEEVELLLNGRSLGRRKAGAKRNYLARFRTPYEPGEITAVAYGRGVETGRRTLRSAKSVRLRLRSESEGLDGPDDLAYVWVELADDAGTVDVGSDDRVVVTVHGAAALAGLGSAAPSTEESYTDDTHTTYRGRALAVIRGGTGGGPVTVRVVSERHGEATLTLLNRGDDLTAPLTANVETEPA